MKKNYSLLLLLASLGISAQNLVPNEIVTLNSTIAYQGAGESEAFFGQAEYEIFADFDGGVFDKPIILVDGFDPNDSRSIPMIYELLNYGTDQNLADDLREQGFDIVIMNFPNYTRQADGALISGGSDYIQRNAMNLVELINIVNAQKVGDQQNVVIGPSMGGLITRYALRYLEMNGLDHDTRLYISFDAPHRGANIPIGFQHLFNYMAYGPLGDAIVQVLVDAMLKSPASSQMLIDHFEGHLQDGSAFNFNPSVTLPTGKPNFRDAFQTELDAMGFPENTRNVAISNGSGSGATNGTPGMLVMDHTFNVDASTRAIINLNFTPAAGQQIQVSRFRGQINLFGFWITAYESAAQSQSTAAMDGLDSAPGGKFDITGLQDLVASNAMLTEFFNNLQISYFDFIPTHSSLAINNGSTDWYSSVTAADTPFDAVYIPAENENHVTLTPANVAFALSEILAPLKVKENVFGGLLVQNPVGSSVNIFSAQPIAGASMVLTDISGKKVFETSGVLLDGYVSIPVSLPSGMYFMTLEANGNRIVKKLLKN